MKINYLLLHVGMVGALGILCFVGCGYRTLAGNGQTIAVPIFDNKTIYQGHEFDLTRLVHQRILSQTPLLLVERKDQADFLLTGEISDYTKPVLLEASNDQVIVSQIAITLKIMLTDAKTGKVIYQGSRMETGSLVSMRDQTETSARAEAFDKLVGWVVASFTTKTIEAAVN